MKHQFIIFFLILAFVGGVAIAASSETDISDIKAVIQKAYVEGIHNYGDLNASESGFHPGFEMLIMRNNLLEKLPISVWIENLRQRRAAGIPETWPEITCKYLEVDVTGDAAVVKLELHRDGVLLFTDYLCLYRFEEGWKIVSKLFHRH